MSDNPASAGAGPSALRLAAGADRFGEQRRLGINHISFKVAAPDSSGLFIIEVNPEAPGGPERHVHLAQEEWFYIVAGEFLFEIAGEQTTHTAGETVLVPRGTPHAWAAVSATGGRMVIVFNPAGTMEAFFRRVAPTQAMPSADPALWEAYGMRWIGPPLLKPAAH